MSLTADQKEMIAKCRVAIVSTIGRDGQPQVTATWFLLEDDIIKLSIASRGQKAHNLQRDPRATLFFIDPVTSLHTVELRGTMTMEDDPDFTVASRIGAKYDDDLTRYLEPGEIRLTVTLHPAKVVAFNT